MSPLLPLNRSEECIVKPSEGNRQCVCEHWSDSRPSGTVCAWIKRSIYFCASERWFGAGFIRETRQRHGRAHPCSPGIEFACCADGWCPSDGERCPTFCCYCTFDDRKTGVCRRSGSA